MLTLTWTAKICITVAGGFFMVGLATGVWKYRHMLTSDDHRAPVYVDIAHRAALMYAFASLLLAVLAAGSKWPEWLDAVGAIVPIFFFAAAVVTYVLLGFADETDNQFEQNSWHTTWGTLALAVGEIGGASILFSGFIAGIWL